MCNDCLKNIVLNEKYDSEHEDNLKIVEFIRSAKELSWQKKTQTVI